MRINRNTNVSFNGLEVTRPEPFTKEAARLLEKINVYNCIQHPVGWRYEYMVFKSSKIEAVVKRILEAANIKVKNVSDEDADYWAHADDVLG